MRYLVRPQLPFPTPPPPPFRGNASFLQLPPPRNGCPHSGQKTVRLWFFGALFCSPCRLALFIFIVWRGLNALCRYFMPANWLSEGAGGQGAGGSGPNMFIWHTSPRLGSARLPISFVFFFHFLHIESKFFCCWIILRHTHTRTSRFKRVWLSATPLFCVKKGRRRPALPLLRGIYFSPDKAILVILPQLSFGFLFYAISGPNLFISNLFVWPFLVWL